MSNLKARYSLMREDFNREIFMVTLVAAVGAFTYGYDLNWWGAMIAHPYFNETFGSLVLTTESGVVYHSLSANQQSVGTAMSGVGAIIGNLIAPAVAKPLGYRYSMAVAAAFVIAGSLVQVTSDVGGSSRYWQLLAGKVVITVGVGMNSVNLPVYLNGCAPPRLRGAMLNVYTSVVGLAAVVASSIVLAEQFATDRGVWLIPISVQFTTPVLTLATLWLVPETPNWLVSKHRQDDALKVLQRLRPRVPVTDLEVEVSVESALLEKEKRRGKSAVVACFRGPNLMRTLTVLGMMCFFAAQGLGFVLGYFAVLLVQLGIPNVFQILVIIYCLLFLFSILSMFYQDAVGRRAALLLGAALMATCMLGFASILTVYPTTNKPAADAAVALVILWVCIFTATWYSLTWTIATEMPAIELRPISLTISNVGQGIVGLIITFVTPYLQDTQYGNLGARIGYIYGSFSVIAFGFVFFAVPELRGRPAVEIDWLFQHKIPVRQMKDHPVPSVERISGGDAVIDQKDIKNEVELVEDKVPQSMPVLPA